MDSPSHLQETAHMQPELKPTQQDYVSQVLGMLGDKWTILVISKLSEGSLRFNALRREIPAVSQKMLTSTLRNLERSGIVLRRVTPTSPPQVEYSLTDLGMGLRGSMCSIAHWAYVNADAIEAAQHQHDSAK